MQFIAGFVVGGIGVASWNMMSRRPTPIATSTQGNDSPETAELQERLSRTLQALAGAATAEKQLTHQLAVAEKRNEELEQKVRELLRKAMPIVESMPNHITVSTPLPPPPPGKLPRKRGNPARIESKALLAEFAAFAEKAENKDLLVTVKTALRLDFPSLTRSAESAVHGSLSNILGKWLKEQKLPIGVQMHEWEEAVDESLIDVRSEKLYSYNFPNAKQVVKEAISFLRVHYQPNLQQKQGNVVGELTDKIARRKKQ